MQLYVLLMSVHSVNIFFFENKMRNLVLATVVSLWCVAPGAAQQRLVNEVKKDISAMTLTVDNYRNSLKKINKALENDETKDKAEPWWVAGKIQFLIYDKMMNNKAAGEKIKSTDAALALIDGYDKFSEALSKDTVFIIDKKGNTIIDKKTGKKKFKTKYSQDIVNRILSHLVDYSAVAGDLYLAGDWENAYKAWDIYCTTAQSQWARKKKIVEPDSVIGYNRFFQGLAACQNNQYGKAVEMFALARNHGYRKKALYDAWIDALINEQDTIYLVSVAHEAHDMLATADPRYVRILINHYLKTRNYSEATVLLDEVLLTDPAVAEYHDLKGSLLDSQHAADEAISHYRKAVELNSELAMAQFHLGNALYSKAIAIDEQRSPQALNLYREALTHLEKAHTLMPANEDVKRILRRIYYVVGSDKLDNL